MRKPHRIYRELDVCPDCERVDSFRIYKSRGKVAYAKCICGTCAIIQKIINLRTIARNCHKCT
jgi:hypothetical protein